MWKHDSAWKVIFTRLFVLRRRALSRREEKGEGELKTEFALLLILPLKSLLLYKFYAFKSLKVI
ncbi:MAG: hypothetical protein QXV01_01550 [Candidatus Bathyarchaeia archaeon]